jgi:hypothetical protein
VSDGSIQFPPGQRREKPKFEPPPWEREQFDELARRKQAEEAIPAPEPELEPAPAPEPAPEAAAPAATEGPPHAVATEGAKQAVTTVVAEQEPEQVATPEGEAVEAAEQEKVELDPKQVEMLLMGLRAEEPRAEEAYWKITTIVGAASALIGLLLTVWGVVALATPKKAGAGGAFLVTGLLLFGIGFLVGGVWVVFRSLRQQGVL